MNKQTVMVQDSTVSSRIQKSLIKKFKKTSMNVNTNQL